MLLTCSMKAMVRRRPRCAGRKSRSRNWRVTSPGFRMRWHCWSRRVSALKTWAPRCGITQVEDRLAMLDRLKRKYGPTLDEVIHFGADVSQKLAEVENKDEILRQLRG